MTILGISLCERPDAIPKEVAQWLSERNEQFPFVEFVVDVRDVLDCETDEHEILRKKFSRIFLGVKAGDKFHIKQISFLYPREEWRVRIVGGVDENGNIVDPRTGEGFVGGFTHSLRREIFGSQDFGGAVFFQSKKDKEGDFCAEIPIADGGTPLDGPELVPMLTNNSDDPRFLVVYQ